jgi:hypothetical protein
MLIHQRNRIHRQARRHPILFGGASGSVDADAELVVLKPSGASRGTPVAAAQVPVDRNRVGHRRQDMKRAAGVQRGTGRTEGRKDGQADRLRNWQLAVGVETRRGPEAGGVSLVAGGSVAPLLPLRLRRLPVPRCRPAVLLHSRPPSLAGGGRRAMNRRALWITLGSRPAPGVCQNPVSADPASLPPCIPHPMSPHVIQQSGDQLRRPRRARFLSMSQRRRPRASSGPTVPARRPRSG